MRRIVKTGEGMAVSGPGTFPMMDGQPTESGRKLDRGKYWKDWSDAMKRQLMLREEPEDTFKPSNVFQMEARIVKTKTAAGSREGGVK
jgi:hypothetical protein